MNGLRMLPANRGNNAPTGQETRADCDPSRAAHPRWAVILAGGDGKRLLPLTRQLSGDDRPKQFCKLLGAETLLDQTLRRVARVVSPERTFSVVTKAHESFYSCQPSETLLIQPCNQGTGPAIMYSLACLRELDPEAVVGIFPSDHHFADDHVFTTCVTQAYEFAESHPDTLVLLGIRATHPETGYGWIEPGEPLHASGAGRILKVRGFWEKPSSAAALELMRRGCVWNSFIMFGRLPAFRELIRGAVPHLIRAFRAIGPALFTKDEESSVRKVYRALPAISFAQDVLSVSPGNLAVAFNEALEWDDVGEVDRVLALIRRRRRGRQEALRIAAAAS